MTGRPLGALLVGLTEQHPYAAAFRAHPGFGPVRLGGPDDIGGDDADVVCVCVPLAGRADVVTAAVRAGRHVVVHGVLAEDPDRAAAVAALARAQGTVCLPDYHFRFQPAVRSARAAVAAGRVGLPWNLQGDLLTADTNARPESMAVHAVDTARALIGLPVRTVHAHSAGSVLLLLLTHDHGVTSTLAVGHTPGRQPDGLVRHRYRVSGSHGVLDVDARRPALAVDPPAPGAGWHGADSMAELLTALHTAVVTGQPAELSLDDAVEAQRIVTAAIERSTS